MWWLVFSLVWWCGCSAIPSPGTDEWKCPEIAEQPILECSCDIPHTLRCTGDRSALAVIARTLRSLKAASISLLDCTVQNVSVISGPILEGVALHGLVVSSGEIRQIHPTAFQKLASPLQALGLPNNQLFSVPTEALTFLPELDRLDLSGNRLKSLDKNSFKGLRNLSFIDLSENGLSRISPTTFENLPQLKILRLRGNRLTVPTVTKLISMCTVEELDASENAFVGPLGPNTLPRMDNLKYLQLSHNSFSSIKMGALKGLTNLTSLRLSHNQIDVIEDHAFSHLTFLLVLDLAHNRIVAVSGASLAHLINLTDLDVRHNFLRALTADLIIPLKSLRNLNLDENDISIVASDAFKSSTVLHSFTLSENPLNCDCSLNEFATWLNNATLNYEDKSSAVCTTPPSLENGLLIEVPSANLLCGDDEHETMTAPLSAPFQAKINLREFKYDGTDIQLKWSIEDEASRYTCDAIFVYEEQGPNEVLVESFPIKCNSSEMMNPKLLNLSVPHTFELQQEHRYRYCVVLLESGQTHDVSLILGCSDVLPLIQNVKVQQTTNYSVKLPKVISIRANLSTHGVLSINVHVYPDTECQLNLAILQQNVVLSQRTIDCETPSYDFFGLDDGPYRVCANVVESGLAINFNRSRCVTVFKREIRGFTHLDIAFVSIFSVLCLMVIVLIWGVRRTFLKPKIETHQYFLPPECEDHVQHNKYVKLEATTKL